MTDFILTRTSEPSAKITGELTGSAQSRNADSPTKESSNRQWFLVDVYRTTKGTFVAHVKYRAGSKLGREEPCDMVVVAPSGEVLFDKLKAIVASEEFVVGWPGDGMPEHNGGRDFTSHDASVCKFADLEWENLLERSSHLFTAVEEIA
jgi:hypothetical protein